MRSPTNSFEHRSNLASTVRKGDDILLFMTPILLIATQSTPIDPIYWLLLPITFVVGKHLRMSGGQMLMSRSDYGIGILATCAVLSLVFSEFQEISVVPTLYFVGFYLYIFAVSAMINSVRHLGAILLGSIIACLILLIRSLFEVPSILGDDSVDRFEGVLAQANATGALAAVAIVSSLLLMRLRALGLLSLPKSRTIDAAIWGTLLLGFPMLFLSASRGSTAATVAFLLLWLLPLMRRVSFGRQLVVAGAGIIAVWLASARISELFVIKRFWHLAWELGVAAAPPEGRFYESVEVRDSLKGLAVQIFYDNPILGSGLGTFKAYSQFVYTHTTFYEILYSLGLTGTAVAVLLWAGFAFKFALGALARSPWQEYFWLLLCVLVFLTIQGMTLPLVSSRTHMPLMILLFAAARLERAGFMLRRTNHQQTQ